jgi:hypothetical protein
MTPAAPDPKTVVIGVITADFVPELATYRFHPGSVQAAIEPFLQRHILTKAIACLQGEMAKLELAS